MKQALLLCAAATTLLFSSCNSDDEMAIDQDELLGEWTLASIEYHTVSTIGDEEYSMTSRSRVRGKDIDSGAAFHANPNEFNTWGSYTAEMEVWHDDMDPNEEGMKMQETMPPFLNGGKWELRNGNVLRIFGPDGEQFEEYRIEVTDQLLVMHMDIDREIDFLGTPRHDKVEGMITYNK